MRAFGFLTVVDREPHGALGGYLLVNELGRPLEFHCTAPIKPSRAQKILFGPTLDDYLYGEQIGATLVGKAGVTARAVLTDSKPLLAVRPRISMPVVLLMAETMAAAAPPPYFARLPYGSSVSTRSDERLQAPVSSTGAAVAERTVTQTEAATVRGRLITAHCDYPLDVSAAQAELASLFHAIDLAEPFGRIREAIDEAQRVSR